MNGSAILEELYRRGVRLRVDADRIIAKPLSAVPPDLRNAAATHKAELIGTIQADAAFALLNRLKTYTVPAGRMPAARLLAERLGAAMVHWENREPGSDVPDDPTAILRTLQGFECELIALGGAPDPELTEAVAMVERSFAGARLVEVRKLQ